jgi:hypothetical protein
MLIMKIAVISVLVTASVLVNKPVHAIDLFDYSEFIENQLVALGIDPEEVERVQIDRQRVRRRGSRRLVGVKAWIRLQSCETGSLIVDMEPSGRVKQVYTRGGCEVPGIRSFR